MCDSSLEQSLSSAYIIMPTFSFYRTMPFLTLYEQCQSQGRSQDTFFRPRRTKLRPEGLESEAHKAESGGGLSGVEPRPLNGFHAFNWAFTRYDRRTDWSVRRSERVNTQ